MLTFGIIKSMSKLHADWCKTAPTRSLTRLRLTRSPDCGETPAAKLMRVPSSLLATSMSVSAVGGSTVSLPKHNHHFRHQKAITVDTKSSFKVACYVIVVVPGEVCPRLQMLFPPPEWRQSAARRSVVRTPILLSIGHTASIYRQPCRRSQTFR